MEESAQNGASMPAKGRKKGLLKALFFLAFLFGALYVIRFTPAGSFLAQDVLERFLASMGGWAPVVFMAAYAAGVCLFVPGTLLTGLGAVLFGPFEGFVYVWLGAMAGASAAFWIGRTLGRDFAASVAGNRLRKYDEAIERNGFAAVLYLRLVYFPFTPMNFGMGLTAVRFRDYLAGTGLGILAGTFIFTFFIGTFKEVWAGGHWGELFSLKVFFSIGLFILSFFIPKLIKRWKKT
jgi:uncharacterized membrane protein YdjX (TVP38/TMEM64 family)